MAALFGEFDLLMVEGLKHLPLPRIGIFRGRIDPDYLPVLQAVAIDDSIDRAGLELPSGIDLLDLNDTDAVIRWIDEHAIELKRN